MAAINKSLVLVPVTLCFLVVLAAAQGDTVVLTVNGEARCKYNPSAVISSKQLLMGSKNYNPSSEVTEIVLHGSAVSIYTSTHSEVSDI